MRIGKTRVPVKTVLLLVACTVLAACKQEVHVTIEFRDGVSKYPAKNIGVKLEGGGEKWSAETNARGEVTFTFKNNPHEVTYRLIFENRLISFSDRICGGRPFEKTGSFKTGNEAKHSETVYINFDNLQTIQAWLYLNDAANAAEAISGLHMDQIHACPGDRNFYSQKTGDITVNISPSLAFLRDKIYHEYGHAVMHVAVGGDYKARNCSWHGIGQRLDPTCAWVEGWADFYALYVWDYVNFGPKNSDPWFQGRNMEQYESSIIGQDGYMDEGRVAAGLWDLYDRHDDSADGNPQLGAPYPAEDRNTGISMKDMVGTLPFLYEINVRNFYRKLETKLTSVEQEEGRLIMYYNYLNAYGAD